MEKNDLKSLWNEMYPERQKNNIKIEEITSMAHSETIAKILSDQKLNILLYLFFFVIFFGLMIYAFVYLGLKLSYISIIPLIFAGSFILFKTTSEIIRLLVLTKTADNMSIKESMLFFQKKVQRIITIDFLSYLVFFYLLLIGIIFVYVKDLGGIKNILWNNEITPFLLVITLMLLCIPWLIKLVSNQRYKKLYSSLKNSADYLKEESVESF